VDRLIVSGTHEATLWACDATPRPHDFHSLKAGNHESPKTRKPENAKARDQSFFVSHELPVPVATDTLYGGSTFFRMRKNLRCATRKSASPKAGNRVSTNNGAPESRKRDTKKAGKQENGKPIRKSSDSFELHSPSSIMRGQL
jgi:hypothetical protein